MTHTELLGGCHCGAVRFAVQATLPLEVLRCNCSICRMSGFLHLIVPRARFSMLQGAEQLSEYRFNTGIAKHWFCQRCGIKPFYVPRSHPDGIDVNICCLDSYPDVAHQISVFDDANREAATVALAHLSKDSTHAT